MKIIRPLILLFIIFSPVLAFSSHYMGGEITWQCLPNGRYRFIMKLYRESNGVTFGTTETISVANCPGLTSISMNLYPGGNPHDADTNGCSSFSQEYTYDPTQIAEYNLTESCFTLYPNPARDKATNCPAAKKLFVVESEK